MLGPHFRAAVDKVDPTLQPFESMKGTSGSGHPTCMSEIWDLRRIVAYVRAYATGLAFAIWSVTLAVALGVLLSRGKPPGSFTVYSAAGHRWLQHLPLYDLGNIDGFQYFPTSALLFAPFSLLGGTAAHIAWRTLNWFAYASGMWRMAQKLGRGRAGECFLIATCLAIGAASTCLANGQANIALGALILHVCAELAMRRAWRASALLVLGFALKPLIGVPILLFSALYPALRWRIPAALGVVFGAPWLVRDSAYLEQQYVDCWTKLMLCANPDRRFEDVRGLFETLGLSLSHAAYTSLRSAAAVSVLGLAYWTRRRVLEPYASFLVGAFACSYLMLFNPRTQPSSYVMVAAHAALIAAVALLAVAHARTRAVCAIIICVCWTITPHMLAIVEFWLRPAACIAFFGVLIGQVWLRRVPRAVTRRSPECRAPLCTP